jgi:hypothetical protein
MRFGILIAAAAALSTAAGLAMGFFTSPDHLASDLKRSSGMLDPTIPVQSNRAHILDPTIISQVDLPNSLLFSHRLSWCATFIGAADGRYANVDLSHIASDFSRPMLSAGELQFGFPFRSHAIHLVVFAEDHSHEVASGAAEVGRRLVPMRIMPLGWLANTAIFAVTLLTINLTYRGVRSRLHRRQVRNDSGRSTTAVSESRPDAEQARRESTV